MKISEAATLKSRCRRSQYFVMYSQVDPEKFQTRESFGTVLQEEFERETARLNCCIWPVAMRSTREQAFTTTAVLR